MAQSSGAAKSHMNGQQDTKKAVRAKPRSSSTNAKISNELNKLCKILNEPNGNSKELYQFASDYIVKNHKTVTGSQDSVYIYENLRRAFDQQRGQGDGPSFDELYRIYKQQAVIKNTDAPLQLFLHLTEEARRPALIPALSNAGFGLAPTPTQVGAGPEDPPPDVASAVPPARQNPPPHPHGNAKRGSLSHNMLTMSQSTGAIVSRPQLDIYERQPEVPEWLLIQDVIYSFQGINGTYLKFDPITQGYTIDPKVRVRPYMRRMCVRLAELSWLHLQVRDISDGWARSKSAGLVHQCLTSVMKKELMEYYRVVAVMNAKAKAAFNTGSNANTGARESPFVLPAYDDLQEISLLRLAVWIQRPQHRFVWLAILCQAAQGMRGGAIASCVFSYLQHGDPEVRKIVQRILSAVCKPIFTMLGRWILDGELDDPYGEFFIAGNSEIKGERLWHEKYRVQESMVPTFMTMEQARKILITGKSINFLREVCNDHTELKGRELLKQALENTSEKRRCNVFDGDYDKSEDRCVFDALFMSDREGELAAMMDSAYLETSKRVIEVLTTQYKFLDHLQALRRYMLLGQGDFIRHLMELLETELHKPATEVFPHNLSGILESAIRATNAQYEDKDILNRLDVRILDQSPGDFGWDVFVLDYHTDGPIGTVFGPSATSYLLLFQALWKMKRVEWVLSRLWTKQITASKELRKIPELDPVMAQIHLLTSEMVNFVHQMQYYVLFEVVACAWEELLSRIALAESLDDIVAAHQTFLRTVKAGALLDSKTLDLSIHLRAMFETILQLDSQVDLLHARANKEMKRRVRKVQLIETRGKQGMFGITAEEEKHFDDNTRSFLESFVPNIRVQLKTLTNSYQSCARKLLLLLSSSQDISLQLLSFRLDFNEHYKRNDPRLSASVTYQQRRLSEMGLGLTSATSNGQ